MAMQAVVQSGPGGVDTLRLDVVEKPEPAPGQLRVRVLAAGLNRADIVQREGKYPPPKGASPILGLEVAGIVDAVNGPSRFQEGDEVFGLIAGGGYAEYALLDSSAAIPKPDMMSWAEAASLPEAWMTAWHNLVDVAGLHAGETVLIHAGASGVGAAAIQLAGMLGCRVLASAGSEEKRDFCRRLGADEVIDSRSPGFAARLKEQGGVDVVLDPVGAALFDDNIAVLKQDGRLVLIGVMSGVQGSLNLGMLLVKRLKVIGSTLRSQPEEVKARLATALEREVLPALLDGRAQVTLDCTYPLAAVQDAHDYMEANRNLGKIVLSLLPVMPG
ncbi:NAD(P)H-quinone oxidoreductase [Vogesella sp. LIG4]|uniref:NAD(P)H-quinone oxidoreductase n=1 Tax=Vogesella sp. LIG4 TaxID=1192162 RepID=UPI00081F930D|nr:NAD(P)H-quinone oxidoreductase [Vogesella sp. LIG4]SCK25302.1 NADPH2:quinone reductase [Vogesella sp. LIG4]